MRNFLTNRPRRDHQALIIACLTATLTTAWGVPQASADMVDLEISGWIEPESDISNGFAFAYFLNDNSSGEYFLMPISLGSFSGGIRTPIQFDISVDDRFLGDGDLQQFSFAGIHDSANDGVTLAIPADSAVQFIADGADWIFAGLPSRQQIAVDLAAGSGESDKLRIVVRQNDTRTDFGQTATLVAFGPAAANGQMFLDIVPEPATFLLVVGAVPLLRRRR